MNQLLIISRKKTENNREYAYRLLRYNIMNLQLKPGETLVENEICQHLNVSRTPVHEALTLLKAEQLVNIVPQSGSRVSLISLKNIREGLFLRNTIEPPIYRQIAGNIPAKYLDAMNSNLKEVKTLLSSSTPDQIPVHNLLQLDDRFHQLAYIAAQKTTTWTAMKTVSSHYDRIRYQGSVEKEDNLGNVYEEHKKIYEFLLLGGDPSFDLESFYNKHLTHFKTYFSKLYNDHPEYFTTE